MILEHYQIPYLGIELFVDQLYSERERLLREPNLNLKQCINIFRASELSKERNKFLDNTDSVSRINSRKLTSQDLKSDRHQESKPIEPCLYCGKQYELGRAKCPAYGKFCNFS